MVSKNVCVINDCGKMRFGHGFCERHLRRFRRHGDPLGGRKSPAKPGAPKKWLHDHADHQGKECLPWPFSRNAYGYSNINIDGENLASRYMCKLAHGEPPTPKHQAAHDCGRGHEGCTNPKHLYWATNGQNRQDMFTHGTTTRGERHGASKITTDQVRQMRDLKGVHTQDVIAEMFGVSRGHVNAVLCRRIWGWLE